MSKTLWFLRVLEARHARTGSYMEPTDLFYHQVLRAIGTGALQAFVKFAR